MFENLILLIIAAAVLAFIGLLWLRQSLLHELREVQSRDAVLQSDYQKRRDTVPYLLESARTEGEPTDLWRKLRDDRSAPEADFERSLHAYLQSNSFRNLNFLEAKKDIEDLTRIIETQRQNRQIALSHFSARRKQFPYSLASAIFGFREIA